MSNNFNRTHLAKEILENNQFQILTLGFGPTLIASDSFSNALTLASATILTLVLTTTLIFLLKRVLFPEIKSISLLIIIFSSVTITELLVQTYAFEQYKILELFFPLIASNFLILMKMETVLESGNLAMTMHDIFRIGLSGFLILLSIGFARELIGSGEVFFNIGVDISSNAMGWKISTPQFYRPLLIATMPPAAFIFCGLLLASCNSIRLKTANI